MNLNVTAAIAELTAIAQAKASGCELLRVYWYDGALGTKGPTLEQTSLAHTDNVKLRLGFINSLGQQKGVDSLIVTDLIDLARNHAIRDAILVSGDEDVRIGVQIAQQFGVRVHLVGIVPLRGSQSRTLQQESDTTTELDQQTVAKFLTVSMPVVPAADSLGGPSAAGQVNQAAPTSPLDKIADDLCAGLDSTIRINLKTHWSTQSVIPPDFDGKLLTAARSQLGRDLTLPERKQLRARFKSRVQAT
jgi:uncharacterized LabA/DUF88 family protein